MLKTVSSINVTEETKHVVNGSLPCTLDEALRQAFEEIEQRLLASLVRGDSTILEVTVYSTPTEMTPINCLMIVKEDDY